MRRTRLFCSMSRISCRTLFIFVTRKRDAKDFLSSFFHYIFFFFSTFGEALFNSPSTNSFNPTPISSYKETHKLPWNLVLLGYKGLSDYVTQKLCDWSEMTIAWVTQRDLFYSLLHTHIYMQTLIYHICVYIYLYILFKCFSLTMN